MIDIESLIKIAKKDFVYAPFVNEFSFAANLLSFRTIGFILPRRSGKTTTLENFQRKNSAILIKKFDDYTSKNKLPYLVDKLSHTNLIGAKYQYVLLDEYSVSEVSDFVEQLMAMDLLTKDFLVISMSS